jgi:hypothetical protein
VVYYVNDTTCTLCIILDNNLWLKKTPDSGNSYYDSILSYDGDTVTTLNMGYNKNDILTMFSGAYVTYAGVIKNPKYPNKLLVYGFAFSASNSVMLLYDSKNNEVLSFFKDLSFKYKDSSGISQNITICSKISPYTGKAIACLNNPSNTNYPLPLSPMQVVKFDIDDIFESSGDKSGEAMYVEVLQSLDEQLSLCSGEAPSNYDYSNYNILYYSSNNAGKFFITGDI